MGWELPQRLLAIAPRAAVMGLLLGGLSAVPADAAPSFDAQGSVEQVYATGVEPGAAMKLKRKGETVARKSANPEGGVLFRHVKPGRGYRLKPVGGGEGSPKLRVLSGRSAPPDTEVYDQELPADGYGYLTTRDGTKLAINVHPPSDVKDVIPDLPIPDPPAGTPAPTLIEYGGYGYADPAGPESGIQLIGNLMGFTVVDVNMRGTGCSGGAFDFFEPLQSLDGYDVVETVARQSWVTNAQVGMMGISYGGISQLFTAQTQPPSLAAITPLSVIDNTQTTLYPGGILNTGFALEWAKDRIHDAKPASPDGGQEWAYQRIQEGDTTCEENQAMHGEARNLLKKIKANDHYRPKVADPLAPVTFVDKIDVPTFMACQYEDEQTGGHCPTLAKRMTGTDKKWFTYTNGTHVDSLAPETFNRWYDFLKLYVAEEAPLTGAPLIQLGAPLLYQEAMGIEGVTLPPDPIQAQPTYETALAAFEELDPVRILFDNGAGGSQPGQPYPGYEQSFAEFPVPGTQGQSWYLGKEGALRDEAQRGRRADGFEWDDAARPPTNFTGDTGAGEGGIWTEEPDYQWEQNVEGNALSYVSEPLAEDTTAIGAGYVRLWVRTGAPSLDLQATVTEVRPDDIETFVQSGWLRTRARKLDREKSTPLEPVPSFRKRDFKAMPDGRFAKVTIPLYYQGHSYRADSRIRVTISAVGGDQPIWAFAKARPKGTPQVDVAHGKRFPSRLTLPIVDDVDVPTELPPCPGLRGEPCRDYAPLSNGPAGD
jgi:predicted acyl esterase